MKGDTFDVDCEQWSRGYECDLCGGVHSSIGGALRCCSHRFEDELVTDGGQVQRLAADSFGPTQQPIVDVLLESEPLTSAELMDETGLDRDQIAGAIERLRRRGVLEATMICDKIRRHEYRLTDRVQRVETDGGVMLWSIGELGPTQREVAEALLEADATKLTYSEIASAAGISEPQTRKAVSRLVRKDIVESEATDCRYGTKVHWLTDRLEEVADE